MSVFACNSCQEVNGVSWLHGKVSQKMFQPIWKGYSPDELHVGYVTNGVHMPTWAASEWKEFYVKTFGPEFNPIPKCGKRFTKWTTKSSGTSDKL